MADDKEKQHVRNLFPLLEKIEDTSLQDKVIAAWLRAWHEGPWKSIESAVYEPVLNVKACTLVQHTNLVAAGALHFGQMVKDTLGLPVNFDSLIAGSLLHDVAKLVEYGPKGELGQKTDFGKMIHHAYYGGYIALDLGIPIDIVELIVSHTPQNRAMPRSIEGIILTYLDLMALDVSFFTAGLKIELAIIKRKPSESVSG